MTLIPALMSFNLLCFPGSISANQLEVQATGGDIEMRVRTYPYRLQQSLNPLGLRRPEQCAERLWDR
jgi:hypothetical protein